MIKTTSLETSKLLKENGYPQNKSSFYSVDTRDNRQKDYSGYKPHWMIVDAECARTRQSNTKNDEWPDEQIAMPNTDELLEELPFNTRILKLNFSFEVECGNITYHKKIINESLPEALSAMWLHLKKEGLNGRS